MLGGLCALRVLRERELGAKVCLWACARAWGLVGFEEEERERTRKPATRGGGRATGRRGRSVVPPLFFLSTFFGGSLSIKKITQSRARAA